MLFFVQLTIQEKSGGRYDGLTPDYRAFLYYRYEHDGTDYEIRGYGATPSLAAADAWERYIKEENAERFSPP